MTQKPLTPRSRSEGSKRSPTAGSSRSTPTPRATSTRSTAAQAGSTRSTTPRTPSTRNAASQPKPVAKVAATPPPPLPRPPSFFRTLLEDPDALSKLYKKFPSWTDEFIALLLIGLGAVAFASLLNAEGEAGLSTSFARLLRQGFGDGAFLVALAILAGGILILLPKLGFHIQITLGRIIALEMGFTAFQGLLHILAFDPEGFALAREGHGGGFMGWGVSYLITGVLGEQASLIVLGFLLFLSAHWLVGLRRQHYRQGVVWVSHQMQGLATRLDPAVTQAAAPPPMATPLFVETPSQPAASQPEPLPESMPEPEPVFASEPDLMPLPAVRRPSSSRRREGANVSTRTEAPPPPMASPAMPPALAKAAPAMMAEPKPMMATLKPPSTPEIPQPQAQPVPPMVALADDPQEDTSTETALPTEEMVSERPALVLNGQVIEPGALVRERPSIVPRHSNGDNTTPKPAVMATPKAGKHKGGRDNNPNKRYFAVADFADRRKIGKRDESLPPLELLNSYDTVRADEEEINRNASIIENTLLEFDLDADVIDVKVGPVVTQYAVSPIKQIYNPETGQWDITRIRVDRITSLQGDLALALSAKTLRIEAPVPGHSYVGIEVPNRKPSLVGLRPALESENFFKKQAEPLAIPVGRDVSGEVVITKLASLPHLLVAGTTGSGKSVFLTSMVMSLIMNNTPDQLKMIMLDPKRVELTRFNGLPHLLGPVETEADRIIGVLRWMTREMDRRYKLMELENARNIEAYNAALGRRRKDDHLPYMVLVFDEIGDLMMSHPDETEGTVTRLAQKARAAGIHLVVATQRPSTEIITGLIKANFPARMSFAVATGVDSRVILDYTGAETLLGKGDMLYLAPDAAGPQRIQGCYVSDEELEEAVQYWKNWFEEQIEEGKLERPHTPPWERGMTRLEALTEQDVLLEQAIALVCEAKEASTSMVQRRLGIGYPRAAHLMDMLYELGVIGPPKSGGQPRTVLITNYKQALKKMSDKSK